MTTDNAPAPDLSSQAHAYLDDQLGSAAEPDLQAPGQAPELTPPSQAAPAPAADPLTDEIDRQIPDDITYRDARRLREEMTASKQRWRPWEDAFGVMADETRDALLQVAPELGDELGIAAGVLAGIHPQDRQAMLYAMDGMLSPDPERRAEAANIFSQLADALTPQQQAAVAQQAVQAERQGQVAQAVEAVAEQSGQQITPEMVQQIVAESLQAERLEMATNSAMYEIHSEFRELGYDPESTDPREEALMTSVAQYAMKANVSLADAHQALWGGVKQEAVDQFVAERRANADRIAPPSGIGTEPSPARQITSIRDASAAADEYLAAHGARELGR